MMKKKELADEGLDTGRAAGIPAMATSLEGVSVRGQGTGDTDRL